MKCVRCDAELEPSSFKRDAEGIPVDYVSCKDKECENFGKQVLRTLPTTTIKEGT